MGVKGLRHLIFLRLACGAKVLSNAPANSQRFFVWLIFIVEISKVTCWYCCWVLTCRYHCLCTNIVFLSHLLMKLKLLHQNVKELNASSSNASPHPGKVHILHPQRTAYSQMPLGFLGWGGRCWSFKNVSYSIDVLFNDIDSLDGI